MSANHGSRKLLIATALEESWVMPGGVESAVFLAPWCRRYVRRHVWEPLGNEVASDPWANIQALDDAIDRVRSLTELSLAGLRAALQGFHGEVWSERESRILLGPWLLSYIPAQLDRWERLALLAEHYPGLHAWCLPPAFQVTPRDTLHAVELLKTDQYNLQLMKPMMDALGVEAVPMQHFVGESQATVTGALTGAGLGRRLADNFFGLMMRVRASHSIAVRSAYFAPEQQLELMLALGLAALPIPLGQTPALAEPEPALRAELMPLGLGQSGFERHLAMSLIADLPTCFLEGYSGLRDGARAMGKHPAAVLSANAWHYDEAFKRWIADAAAAGTVLLGVQHGGNYGIDDYAPSEDHETSITDRYYTWGWTRKDVVASTVPLPATKLMGRPRLSADPETHGVLMITTSMPRYPMQLDCDSERFERYLVRQDTFIAALSDTLTGHFRVRPHNEALGWDIAERIADAHPDVEVESWDVRLADSMKSCRLIVCDHLSTTFAEALAANKPTVLLWDEDTRIRAEARDVFEGLASAGILFEDPRDAAAAVVEAYADVKAWWCAPERIAAVSAFCTRFALTDRSAIMLWKRELSNVIATR